MSRPPPWWTGAGPTAARRVGAPRRVARREGGPWRDAPRADARQDGRIPDGRAGAVAPRAAARPTAAAPDDPGPAAASRDAGRRPRAPSRGRAGRWPFGGRRRPQLDAEAGQQLPHRGAREGQGPGQPQLQRLAGGGEGPEVLGQPLCQVALELLEQVEIGQLVGAAHQQQGPLRERGPRAQVAPPRLAEPPHVGVEPQPGDGRSQAGRLVAERRRGPGQDRAGGPDRVEQLVPLAAGEGPVEAVVLERRVEVGVAERRAVGPAVGRGEGGDQPRPAPAVGADEPLQLATAGREQQLLDERPARGLGARAPASPPGLADHDLGAAGAPRGRSSSGRRRAPRRASAAGRWRPRSAAGRG